MMHTTPVPSTARTLDVPGARLHYEVRGEGLLVVLVGSPMDATSFEPLADLLAAEHTVLTTDPRGINRSTVDDPEQDSTPQMRADDLSRLIRHLDTGPAAVLGSSGGAVSALALAQAHPEQVSMIIAHEAPLNALLPDREQRHAATEAIIAAYLSEGRAAAWTKFMADANITMPEEVFDEMFGGEPDPRQAATERRFFLHELRATTRWQPDIGALSDGTPRIVVGIGADSAGELCDRTSRALAAALGIEPTMFPGSHIGFIENPDVFLTRLGAILREG